MPEMGFYVYIIENILNHKIYVGVSNNPKRRFLEHKRDAASSNKLFHLQKAMKKYIKEIDRVFKISVIEYFDSWQEALCQEIYWISYLKNMNISLYNETNGGEGTFGERNYFYGKRFLGSDHPLYGTKRPQNVLDSLSRAHKGKIISESLKQQWSNKKKGTLTGDQNPMYGMIGEKNSNSGISDDNAIKIYKMYHQDNKLVKNIVKETVTKKSTVDRIIYSTGRFIWTKNIK